MTALPLTSPDPDAVDLLLLLDQELASLQAERAILADQLRAEATSIYEAQVRAGDEPAQSIELAGTLGSVVVVIRDAFSLSADHVSALRVQLGTRYAEVVGEALTLRPGKATTQRDLEELLGDSWATFCKLIRVTTKPRVRSGFGLHWAKACAVGRDATPFEVIAATRHAPQVKTK